MTSPHWSELELLCVDTETTGVDPFTDRIVELAWVLVAPDGTAGYRESVLINPGIDVPESASDVHGLTTERLQIDGMEPAKALARFADLLTSRSWRQPVVIYNARFDWPLILTEARRHDIDLHPSPTIIDPYVIDKAVDKYRKGKRTLAVTAGHYGVELSADEAHGGLADATATGRILHAMVRAFPRDVGGKTLAALTLDQIRWAEEQRASFEEYKRRTEPTFSIKPGWPIPL